MSKDKLQIGKKHECFIFKKGFDAIKIEQIKRGQRFDWFLIDAENEFDSYSILIYYCPWCGVKL